MEYFPTFIYTWRYNAIVALVEIFLLRDVQWFIPLESLRKAFVWRVKCHPCSPPLVLHSSVDLPEHSKSCEEMVDNGKNISP